MQRKTMVKVAVAGLLVLAVAASSGCVAFRRERMSWTDRLTLGVDSDEGAGRSLSAADGFDLAGAKRLSVNLLIGAGDLNVSSAPSGTAEADYVYSNGRPRPESSYRLVGDLGELTIRQRDPETSHWGPFDFRGAYSWDVRLPNGLPTELRVEMGAGSSDLDLRAVDIRRLDFELGAGDATIDLSGPRTNDVQAQVNAGVSSLTLKVPRNVGVRVEGRLDGLGSYSAEGMREGDNEYTNNAYGTSPVTLNIVLRRGIGDVRIVQVD